MYGTVPYLTVQCVDLQAEPSRQFGRTWQAAYAYNAGMSGIQYTIRRVSPALDAQLRREASETGKTLNAVVVQTLESAKLAPTAREHDDLDWFIGCMPADTADEADAQAWLDALPVEPTA